MAKKKAQKRVVLFVEGSSVSTRGRQSALEMIWQNHLVNVLDLVKIDRVIGISKKDILAIFPSVDGKTIKFSGTGAFPIDQRIQIEFNKNHFDIAVVAWDEHPSTEEKKGKSKSAAIALKKCMRWEETKRLYAGLAKSDFLEGVWKTNAAARSHDLLSRRNPGDRRGVPPLESGSILTVCMSPEFESLLVACEGAIRRALGVTDGGQIGWPRWEMDGRMPSKLVEEAIKIAYSNRKKSFPANLPRDLRTAKNEWGEYLIRNILSDENCLQKLRQHPTIIRLTQLLSKNR